MDVAAVNARTLLEENMQDSLHHHHHHQNQNYHNFLQNIIIIIKNDQTHLYEHGVHDDFH